MKKKGVKIGNKFIPVETGGVIPMTEKEWNDFQKEIKIERDYFYMVGDNKYVHYGDEDYIRVSDIEKELDKAREEGREEIRQLLRDKKQMQDYLKKNPKFYKGSKIPTATSNLLKDNK